MSKISSLKIGNRWEETVLRYLEGNGYTLKTKNFKVKGAEIDLILTQSNTIIFVEVKYRKIFEDFENIVTEAKFKRIFMAHEIFIQKNPEFETLIPRFDLIFISKDLSLNHITNISL